MKIIRRFVIITLKACQLGAKTLLIRCFGIDGAACLLVYSSHILDRARFRIHLIVKNRKNFALKSSRAFPRERFIPRIEINFED